MTWLDTFLEFLESIPDFAIYFFLAVSAFVENVFPPIPVDTITAFGAFLVGVGRLSFWGVYISTTMGSVLGFMALFLVGRRLDRESFIERDFRFFRTKYILRAEAWFRKYGYTLVLFNRFLPGVRSAISLAGGFSRLGRVRVAVFALVSAGVWNGLLISLGYVLGSEWEEVSERLRVIMVHYNIVVLILIAVLVVVLVIIVGRRRRLER